MTVPTALHSLITPPNGAPLFLQAKPRAIHIHHIPGRQGSGLHVCHRKRRCATDPVTESPDVLIKRSSLSTAPAPLCHHDVGHAIALTKKA